MRQRTSREQSLSSMGAFLDRRPQHLRIAADGLLLRSTRNLGTIIGISRLLRPLAVGGLFFSATPQEKKITKGSIFLAKMPPSPVPPPAWAFVFCPGSPR